MATRPRKVLRLIKRLPVTRHKEREVIQIKPWIIKSLDLKFTLKEKPSAMCSLSLSQLSLFWHISIYPGTGRGGGREAGGSQKQFGHPEAVNMEIPISTDTECKE